MNQYTHLDIRFNQDKAENFADRLCQVLDQGALAMMLAIGHRSGLLAAMAQLPPATSGEIARQAGLSERYVREWLAALVTGGVVVYNPSGKTYQLPAEHAASLVDGGALGNMAVYAQHVAMLGETLPTLLDCFKSGKGTTYGDYPCFHHVMAEDSEQSVTAGLFDTVLPVVEGMVGRLEKGIDVMDAGCGRGGALQAMAERFPNSRFTGFDLCDDAIAFASQRAAQSGLNNIRFEVRDLGQPLEASSFDFITSFDAVHDQRDPQALMCNIFRALRSGGYYLMQDIGGSARLENNLDFPLATLLYAISCFHCTPISLGQGGDGLGTMWGWETAQQMLALAGLINTDKHVFPHDPLNVWFVSKKP